MAALRRRSAVLLCVVLWSCAPCAATPRAQAPTPPQAEPQSQVSYLAAQAPQYPAKAAAPRAGASPGYTLSPEQAARARAYAQDGRRLYFFDLAYSVIVLLLLLHFRAAVRFRDWAVEATHNRFLQAVVFTPLFLWSFDALCLPSRVVGHWLSLRYGQSIQGWASWLWDWAKNEFVSAAAAAFIVWLVYAAIRMSERRWWFYAWAAVVPVLIFSTFVTPYLIEPLYYRFTPLADSQPELVRQMERVVVRAGQHIPESRMFLMDASGKLNSLNAYVTGIGGSERVVIWDTTVARMSVPQILIVFGHELGHYVLGHMAQSIAFDAAVYLAAFFIGSYAFRWLLERYGAAWGVRGPSDWTSFPALLLLALALDFASTPVSNAFSRHIEHQADQYGLEVVHGIVPNAPEVAVQAFQILGEVDLLDPSPSRLDEVWFYSHPPMDERIRFAETYDPWARGEAPRFVK